MSDQYNINLFCTQSVLIWCGIVETHTVSMRSTHFSKSRMTIWAQEGGTSTRKKNYKFSCLAQSEKCYKLHPPPPRVRWSLFRVDPPPPTPPPLSATVILIPGWSLFRDALYLSYPWKFRTSANRNEFSDLPQIFRMYSFFVRKPPHTKYTKIKCIRNILDLH